MTRIHRAAACFFWLVPLLGLASGRGGPTFSMYAASGWFRFEIIARDAQGRAHEVAPSALAGRATPSARGFLAGGDHFRRTYDTATVRRHLGDLGRLACDVDAEGAGTSERAVTVEMTLFEHSGSSATESGDESRRRATRETVACAR